MSDQPRCGDRLSHCDHVVDVRRDSFRTETDRKCCHCGRRETEIVEHRAMGYGGGRTSPDKHGPHMPRPGVPTW